MIRKFECWNCKKVFDADDADWVVCKYCGSDNVEYASFHLPAYTRNLTLGVVAAGALGVTGYYAYQSLKPTDVKREYNADEAGKFTAKADSTYINSGGTIAPSLSISLSEYDEEKGTYHCKFDVAYPPEAEWKIVISTYYGNKVVAESSDGEFTDLPYSNDDGFYRVKLVDAKSGELLCEERDFPVFEKQTTIKKPWTKAELESVLNSKKSLVDNPYLAHNHEVVIENKPAGDTSETSSLGQVQDLLQMCSLKATVVSVEHNDMNQIIKAVLKINYPDDWITDEE